MGTRGSTRGGRPARGKGPARAGAPKTGPAPRSAAGGVVRVGGVRGGGGGARARDSDSVHINALFQRIYKVVRKIPRGKVATYGQVAELAGLPRGARVAGAAMRASGESMGLPWHRVIGKRSPTSGKVSILDPIGGAIQQKLLESEGVKLSDTGSISLRAHGWLPVDS